ncbi:Uncharacterized protein Adt_22260 [Abeliophyllum distichum]|uniref:RNase H type-1 domain-containing protein n=1 Tax=Abeliophyllum distichum TaxID=126358 RepID=A0ABD1T1N9_9LAMI
MGSYKINTDGCVKDGFANEGRIIRDSSDLWIESDSTLVIHCMTKGGGPWSIQATLRHIKHLIAFDRDIISHIYREENQMADLLTSEDWERRYYFEYNAQDLPQHYRSLVQIDKHEFPTVRGI